MADFGYRASLPSSVVPRYTPTSPGVGAAIGRGLQQLGGAGAQALDDRQQTDDAVAASEHRIALRQQARERATMVAIKTGEYYERETELAATLEKLRENSAPGAPGYGDAAAEEVKGWGDNFLQEIEDTEVREHFLPIVQRTVGRLTQREAAYEIDRRNTLMGAQVEKALQIAAATVQANPTGGAFEEQRRQGRYLIGEMGLDGTSEAVAIDLWDGALVRATADGRLAAGDHEGVEALLSDPALAPHLGGAESVQRYQQRVDASRDVEARQAEAAVKEQQAAAMEVLRVIQVDIDNGNPPAQSEIEAAMAAARQAGVRESDVREFAYEGDRAVRAQAALGMETATIESEHEALQGRLATGQGTIEDARQLEAYKTELKRRDLKAGGALKALAAENPVAAVQQLTQMTPERRAAAAEEAGEPRLAVYANLTPKHWAFAVEGRKLRDERPDDFLPPKDTRGRNGGKERAEAIFRAMAGRDVVDQLGEYYSEHVDAALDVMAGTGRAWNEANFRKAVQLVFGQTRRADGVLTGGIGQLRHGQRVELPGQWSGSEFDNAFQRFDFDGATIGGKPADPADIRRHFRPRYVRTHPDGKTDYYLMGPDGRLLARGDKRFVLRLGKKP